MESYMDPVAYRLRFFLVLLFVVLVLGTLGFMITEDLSAVDALYFNLVTIATVGYGDIHPYTQMGKLLAIAMIITGVGTFLGVIANVTEMMLNRREKELRVQKLNMVSGLFFSEIGTELIAHISKYDPDSDIAGKELIVNGDWSDRDFMAVSQRLKDYDYAVDVKKLDLQGLRNILEGKTSLLLRLLENPALLENESFSELLRAVFHLKEELFHREDLAHLPDSDLAHLAGDIKRAHSLLVHKWLDYMKHLKDNCPYLFSLAMRTNPFDSEASPIVK